MNKSKTKPLSREFRAVGRDLSARLLAGRLAACLPVALERGRDINQQDRQCRMRREETCVQLVRDRLRPIDMYSISIINLLVS